jgi:hypothetical protein
MAVADKAVDNRVGDIRPKAAGINPASNDPVLA